MTIPPMEFPPSRATNKAVPVPIGSDPDLTVEPDDTQADGGTAAPFGDSATDDRGGDVDR